MHPDGRTLKASLGTTKYCSHFMKNQACPKNDCMYLHELGDGLASFTKEQMQQGKHTEYEKALHEEMLAGLALNPPSPVEGGGEGEGGAERREEEGRGEWRPSPTDYPPTPGDWSGGSGGGGAGRSGGGGGGGEQGGEWGNRGGGPPPGEQSWPDLAVQGGQGYSKGRFVSSNSKEEDRSSKSKRWRISTMDSSIPISLDVFSINLEKLHLMPLY